MTFEEGGWGGGSPNPGFFLDELKVTTVLFYIFYSHTAIQSLGIR